MFDLFENISLHLKPFHFSICLRLAVTHFYSIFLVIRPFLIRTFLTFGLFDFDCLNPNHIFSFRNSTKNQETFSIPFYRSSAYRMGLKFIFSGNRLFTDLIFDLFKNISLHLKPFHFSVCCCSFIRFFFSFDLFEFDFFVFWPFRFWFFLQEFDFFCQNAFRINPAL